MHGCYSHLVEGRSLPRQGWSKTISFPDEVDFQAAAGLGARYPLSSEQIFRTVEVKASKSSRRGDRLNGSWSGLVLLGDCMMHLPRYPGLSQQLQKRDCCRYGHHVRACCLGGWNPPRHVLRGSGGEYPKYAHLIGSERNRRDQMSY